MSMKVVHALQPLRKSIFLAGPTPRDGLPAGFVSESWRPDALRYLADLGFDGDVFVPEASDWGQHGHYDDQVLWEWEALHQATVVAFWVPREILYQESGLPLPLLKMPAFTTNVEFGLYANSGKMILGYPRGAEKVSYLAATARRFGAPLHAGVTLQEFMEAVVRRVYTLYEDLL